MHHSSQVPENAAGQRLDVWLETVVEGVSRTQIANAIRSGGCIVEPGQAKSGYKLRGGETVTLELPEVELSEIEPEDIPLQILYEDDDLIVIDKAAGMVVHPAVGHTKGTLVNALLGRYGLELGGEPWRPGIIHRLDAQTSGIVCVARHIQALDFFQNQWRERQVKKRYLALAAGVPRVISWECSGFIGRNPKDFRKRQVVSADARGAKEALTRFLVRHQEDTYAVIEAHPHTGRTHQIRVHLASSGHPVLADATYGRSATFPPQYRPGQQVITRHALHAWALDLTLMNGQATRFFSPIPADLAPWVPAGLAPMPD